MSNGHELEIKRAAGGGLFLTYWDSLHGQDRSWFIQADGKVFTSEGAQIKASTNLERDLLGLMNRIEASENNGK